jgi:DNA (cytosine-5)-methyltransferase 1
MRSAVSIDDREKIFDHITRPVREDDRQAFEMMTHDTKYTDLSAEHQRYRSDIFDDKYNRLNENDLSRTITAHIAKDGYWYIHPRQSRTLTVREAARLQTFPDTFRFDGPPSAAFRQIGNAVPPQLGFVMGQAILTSLEEACDAGPRTRYTATCLASWFDSRRDSLAVPWLGAHSRWEVIAGQVLLERAPLNAIRRIWPVLRRFDAAHANRMVRSELREGLLDMARNISRGNRAESILSLADRMKKSQSLLDGRVDTIKQSTGLSESVIDLAVLVVPGNSSAKEDEGVDEPVLVTKGVLRVARRFQANAVDRKNKMTDGRMAVARMIGFGPDARRAHLGLIEIANSICKPERPLCDQCPLVEHCAKDGLTP